MTSVSERVATTIAEHAEEVFALMGNGNAYLLDAINRTGIRTTAVRHETATVAAADAYYRLPDKLAVASTTFGPGFTNTITSLAEAAQARTPHLLVVGDSPSTGARPWDVDQRAIAQAVGTPTYTITAEHPAQITTDAIRHALVKRIPVVLAIPYDLGYLCADPEPHPRFTALPGPIRPEAPALEEIADILTQAERPLILAGRGAKGTSEELGKLADTLGALTATTAPARGLFAGHPFDLGVAGGFASPRSAELIHAADVILAVGAGLNQYTTSFGHAFGDEAQLLQIDIEGSPTHASVQKYLRADAQLAVQALAARLAVNSERPHGWRTSVPEAESSRLHFARNPGNIEAPDGRLDPRSTMRLLNEILPADRVVVSDGGHFMEWANAYLEIPATNRITLVGTSTLSIGLGFPSSSGAAVACPDSTIVVATGDGGGLMGLPDLDTLVRTARSAVVLVFNDAAYGAEVHQYGSQGLNQDIMMIPQVDFTMAARACGAQAAAIHSLNDLQAVTKWVEAGAEGTFVADLRISGQVIAPHILEVIEATIKRR